MHYIQRRAAKQQNCRFENTSDGAIHHGQNPTYKYLFNSKTKTPNKPDPDLTYNQIKTIHYSPQTACYLNTPKDFHQVNEVVIQHDDLHALAWQENYQPPMIHLFEVRQAEPNVSHSD